MWNSQLTFETDGSKGKLHLHGSKVPLAGNEKYIAADLYMDADFGFGLEDKGGYRQVLLASSPYHNSNAQFFRYIFSEESTATELFLNCEYGDSERLEKPCEGWIKMNDITVRFTAKRAVSPKSKADFGYAPSAN